MGRNERPTFFTVPGYEVLDRVTATPAFGVYRARRASDQASVLLKLPETDHPPPEDLEELRQEYAIGRTVGSAHVLPLIDICGCSRGQALVYDDPQVLTLRQAVALPLPIKEGLELAMRITEALADLHRRGLVHSTLRPETVWIAVDGKIYLSGLAHAISAATRNASQGRPRVFEASLPYMAPEQLGHAGLHVGSATDFYSLGALFYELFAGRPPFQGGDTAELIHAHVAITPPSPRHFNAAVPPDLSQVLLRLLAKDPAERYRSAAGLMADLRHCLEPPDTEDGEATWTAGTADTPEHFELPNRLYGRTHALQTLDAAFGRAAQGGLEWVFVTGPSGVGKSTLVNAFRDGPTTVDACFVAGKFEPLHREMPYGALISAFRQWVEVLLTEEESLLQRWRCTLVGGIGRNLRAITEVIPELEFVVGKQAALPPLEPTETQYRFERALRGLIGILARPRRPLVMVLDDLQWADPASFRLLSNLSNDRRQQHLMVLATYRDIPVNGHLPVAEFLSTLRHQQTEVTEIDLQPLAGDEVRQLVADTFRRSSLATGELADWVVAQTEGNPLFVRQLLNSLYEGAALSFDAHAKRWEWDWERIRALGLSEDLVGFMAEKVGRLPDEVKQTLSLAACLGTKVDVDVLVSLTKGTRNRVLGALQAAAHTQLIQPATPNDMEHWTFVHDRIQQAAYSLLPRGRRARVHRAIARLLLKDADDLTVGTRLFDVVNQFNLSEPGKASRRERLKVARLSLVAGQRSKAAAAYHSALRYLRTGTELLESADWQAHYELTFSLHIELAECEYITGSAQTPRDLFDRVLDQARNPSDKHRAYTLHMVAAVRAGDHVRALQLGAAALAPYGVDLPTEDEAIAAAVEDALALVQAELSGFDINHPPDDLAGGADSHDAAAVASTLSQLYASAYIHSPQMFVLVVLKLVDAALKAGRTPYSAFAFMSYAIILGSFLGDYERGERFARWALDMGEHTDDSALRARLAHLYGTAVAYWTHPLREATKHIRAAITGALQNGDLIFTGLAVSYFVRHLIMQGDPLNKILEEIDHFQATVDRLRFAEVANTLRVSRQWVLALKGRTRTLDSFSDDQLDEDELRESIVSRLAKPPHHWFYLLKAKLHYMAGDFARAKHAIDNAEVPLASLFGRLAVAEHTFYRALIHAALHSTVSGEKARTYEQIIAESQDRLAGWSRHCAANFHHRERLVAAELARLRGDHAEAMSLFNEAARAAGEQGFTQDQALAHELAAGLYGERGLTTAANAHLTEAHYLYQRWGATEKARRIGLAHPELARQLPLERSGADARAQYLDLNAITKASLAIAGELQLDRLLESLMGLVLEHAGAQRGLLILARSGTLRIEAEGRAEEKALSVLQGKAIEPGGDYPLSVINYVRRSRQNLVLSNASGEHTFSGDPYIQAAPRRSILCMPIVRQGQLLGLLYLENHLIADAFTPAHLDILELLTSHASTGLENAMLYNDLKSEIVERRRAEAAALANERRWLGFLENVRLAVVGLDVEGRVEFVNTHFLELTGYRRDEVMGRQWFQEFLPARHRRPNLKHRYYDLLKRKFHTDLRGMVLTRSGEERTVAWSNALLRNGEGEIIGTLSIGEDITARLKAEYEVRSLNRDLEERVVQRTAELRAANEELEAFSYSVSHDLRGPLRSMEGFSSALEEDYGDALDESAADYLRRIRRASHRMATLIDAMLQLSRLTRGIMHHEPVNLSELAEDISEELRARSDGRDVEVHIQPEVQAVGDPRLLRVVLDNLLGNAWKYTGGTPSALIEFGTVPGQSDQPTYFVRDNGAGFDMAFSDKLFTAFQRLHAPEEFEGTGIGLATVQRVIRRHGGRIWAEGKVAEGACFYFTLGGTGKEASSLNLQAQSGSNRHSRD